MPLPPSICRWSVSYTHLDVYKRQVARNTLANANAVRPWQIYADFAQSLIAIARPLYVDEPFGVDLKESVYALDTTTIDLCLSVFPWAPFRSTKAAVKLHTLLDLRGNIPVSYTHLDVYKRQVVGSTGAFARGTRCDARNRRYGKATTVV